MNKPALPRYWATRLVPPLLLLLSQMVAGSSGPSESRVFKPSERYSTCERELYWANHKLPFSVAKDCIRDQLNELYDADELDSAELTKRMDLSKLESVAKPLEDNCPTVFRSIRKLNKSYKSYKKSFVPYLRECKKMQAKFCKNVKKDLFMQWRDYDSSKIYRKAMIDLSRSEEIEPDVVRESLANMVAVLERINTSYGYRLQPELERNLKRYQKLIKVCDIFSDEFACGVVFSKLAKYHEEQPHMKLYLNECEAVQRKRCNLAIAWH